MDIKMYKEQAKTKEHPGNRSRRIMETNQMKNKYRWLEQKTGRKCKLNKKESEVQVEQGKESH